jgi:pimeloyl-ACP methyl ester carboxylesterase
VLRLMQSEALAYLRIGLSMPVNRRLARGLGARAEFGVVFVPGVGANERQFIDMAHALRDDADHFDAFDYSSLRHPQRIADDLHRHLEQTAERCSRFLVIGHSLGGVLARMVLQREAPHRGVAGFVSICAPLHGTWRCRLAPHPGLRMLLPNSPLMQDLFAGAHRLERWKGSVLSIGSRYDQFIRPYDSAFLDGHDRFELEDVAHNGALFDPRVHDAIAAVARRACVP